jgi:hypothetical protein
MRPGNAATDREPHACSLRLGREEWLKYLLLYALFKARPLSTDLEDDCRLISHRRANPQNAWPLHGLHCVHAVPSQIQQHLLNLYCIDPLAEAAPPPAAA